MRCIVPLASCLLLLCASASRADKLVLVAGGGDGADGTEATKAKLIQPFGVDFWQGEVFIVEMAKGERLRTIDKKGRLLTVAGSGETGSAGDAGDANCRAATFETRRNDRRESRRRCVDDVSARLADPHLRRVRVVD